MWSQPLACSLWVPSPQSDFEADFMSRGATEANLEAAIILLWDVIHALDVFCRVQCSRSIYYLLVLSLLMAPSYREISSVARQRRDAVLASFYNVSALDETNLPNDLTAFSFTSGLYRTNEAQILQSEAEDILQNIRDKIWTSLEVTEAFTKAAAIAQKMVSLNSVRDVG